MSGPFYRASTSCLWKEPTSCEATLFWEPHRLLETTTHPDNLHYPTRQAPFTPFCIHLLTLRPHPHYPKEIWKGSFVSLVRPTIQNNPSPKQSFSKTPFTPEEFETLALGFSVDEKHFENEAFRKRWRHDNHVISLPEFSSNTNPKWPGIVVFSNFSGVVWTENIWCVFRMKAQF